MSHLMNESSTGASVPLPAPPPGNGPAQISDHAQPSGTSGGFVGERPVRVLLVDDDPLVCAGLELMLTSAGGIAVVGSVRDGDLVVEAVQRHSPDVVLMDVRMPRMDGITATRSVLALANAPRVLVLTTFAEDQGVLRSIEAGAAGFLLKTAGPAQIIDAVRAVAAGEGALSSSSVRQVFAHVAADPVVTARREAARQMAQLTDRERDIVVLVARGLTNSDVARHLFISEATVKTHLASAQSRLGCTNRVAVAVLAERAGMLS